MVMKKVVIFIKSRVKRGYTLNSGIAKKIVFIFWVD